MLFLINFMSDNTQNDTIIPIDNDNIITRKCLHVTSCTNKTLTIISLHIIILTNTVVTYVLCFLANSPNDCVHFNNVNDTFTRITNMLLHILFLFYFNKLYDFDSYHIYNFNNYNNQLNHAIKNIICLGSNVTFSYISSINVLQSSITPERNKNFEINNVLITIYAIVTFITGFVIVKNICLRSTSLVDILNRIIITLWYSIWAFIFFKYSNNVHLHHTLFSFLTCIWCYKNTPSMQIIFFISLGIFIQGSVNYPCVGLISSNIDAISSKNNEVSIQETQWSSNTNNIQYVNVYICEIEQACYICFDGL